MFFLTEHNKNGVRLFVAFCSTCFCVWQVVERFSVYGLLKCLFTLNFLHECTCSAPSSDSRYPSLSSSARVSLLDCSSVVHNPGIFSLVADSKMWLRVVVRNWVPILSLTLLNKDYESKEEMGIMGFFGWLKRILLLFLVNYIHLHNLKGKN